MLKLRIKSVFKNYQIIFISDLKKQVQKLVDNESLHFIVDHNIWQIYKKELGAIESAQSFKLFDTQEKNKNLKEIHKYIEFLLEKKIQKNHKIVVIGGGLVQDIGSFTAHIMKRGVDWIFIPTTLLSMTDSCIGGKSGINVDKHKNQVGTFHPPAEIYIYSNFIQTLPDKEMINGIGEIIKHVLIKGGTTYEDIKRNLKNIQKNKKLAEQIIYQSLLIKKEIVEEDELDLGIRKLLNYGHTFGHALEGYSKNKIPHGLGVLIGMDMANFISMKRKFLSKSEFKSIHQFLKGYIPVKKVEIENLALYMNFLSKDKKVIGKKVDAVLSRGVGKTKIIRINLDSKLNNNIRDYLKYFNYDQSK